MTDYRKFDKIDYGADSDEEDRNMMSGVSTAGGAPLTSSIVGSVGCDDMIPTIISDSKPQRMAKKGKEGRLVFEHEGQTIYEWNQNLTEVNIYITPPQGVTAKLLDIRIQPNRLVIGLKSTPPLPPFIDEATGGTVIAAESMWMVVDGELNINLQKMNKAEAWDRALIGKSGEAIDAVTKEEVKKQLMLERFQEEHPHFDFSSAEFNGQVPSAKDFMGGVKHF